MITYFGKSDDFPYISNLTFDHILFIDTERSHQNETQSKVDHWDCAGTDCIVLTTVHLASVYALRWIWNDERLRLWDAYDELRIRHDALRNVLHVADPIGTADTHRAGHCVAGKTTYYQSLIRFQEFLQSCSNRTGLFVICPPMIYSRYLNVEVTYESIL